MNKIILIGLFVFLSTVLFGQTAPARFQHLTIADGLSLSSVYCVYRDTKGYMWFGTEDGLNRYDGYHFKVFRSNHQNKNSITYKWIEYILEDSYGNLWFGSRGGLSHFNPRQQQFFNYRFTPESDHSLCNDTITSLSQISDDLVLIGTKNGLNSVHPQTLHIQSIPGVHGCIHTICQGPDSLMWIGSSRGAIKYHSNGQVLEQIPSIKHEIKAITKHGSDIWLAGSSNLYHTQRTAKSIHKIALTSFLSDNETIETLLIDSNAHFWVGTSQGLYLYNPEINHLKKYIEARDISHSLAINPSKSLQEDTRGHIWYGTHGSGVYCISPKLSVTQCTYNPVDPSSISQNSINCIYIDQQSENVWLGTFGAGLNMYDPNANKFELYKHNPLNTNSLASDFVWSICEASDGSIWIGTNDQGISRYLPAQDRFVFYNHSTGRSGTLSNSSVRKIYEDSNGHIWVGTDGGGLNRFNPHTNQFKVFKHHPNDQSSLSDNSVRVIFEDSRQRLWIGTRHGLNRLNRKTNTFHRYMNDPEDSSSISHNFIYSSIIEDKKGDIWIGTYGGGLNRMNPNTGTFTRYTINSGQGSSLSNNIVFSIYEAPNGYLWIGTNEGLNVLNPATGKIRFYGTADGLPNEVIYGILPDEANNLWLSTNHGICCFNPSTGACRNFDVNDGLQSNEFNGGAFHKGHSGYLYFGGVYGLNRVLPGSIIKNQNVNQPVITRLEVMGKSVRISHTGHTKSRVNKADSVFLIDQHISYAKHIELDYKNRFFSLEFSGMNHLFPDKTRYAYQLSPLDREWHQANQRNYVAYANVKPGHYIFKVKSSNPDGEWPARPTELRITVHPPFWLTYWFISLEFIILLIIIIFIHRYLLKIKTNKLLRSQNRQIKEANRQLSESEQRLRQMNATKDKFFSIISHDLKNPFTSLMSISDLMTENYDASDEADRKQCITKIHSSVKQIYNLLENLLTWSRSQRGKISFQKKPFNLSMLIHENANLYRMAAEKKGIRIMTEVKDHLMAFGDRDTINTVIRNLTGNAIKFTPSGGFIQLTIKPQDAWWLVSVIDSGVGISQENINQLFRIDQKIKTDGTDGEKGTGLGLIICKEFVEKNGGQIGVRSQVKEGSEFWFTVRKHTDQQS